MSQEFSTPLCVDLDGSLVETNTLFEASLMGLKKNPLRVVVLAFALLRGKAYVKHLIGKYSQGEQCVWLFNAPLLAFLRIEKAKGRPLILATASDSAIAHAIAKDLGIFDEVIASTVTTPVHAASKYLNLKARFGEKNFSYVGNSRSDLAVWNIAASAVVVHASESIAREVREIVPIEAEFPMHTTRAFTDFFQEIRIHQWLKNLLLFLSPIMAHRIGDPTIFFQALIGFLSFSFVASSMYVMNDLLDIPSDRAHQTKKMRPIALGTISARDGVILAVLLVVASFALAWLFLPSSFIGMLLLYLAINFFYSFRGKRIPYLDILILSGLYVLRILAGSAATNVPTSIWLFVFAGCFFLYLASMKRVIELLQLSKKEDRAPGRGYTKRDSELLIALGMTFALLSCIVLGLYIESETVSSLYKKPFILWTMIPLLTLWIVRMWRLTLTKQMHDDPVLFTSKDAASYAIGALFIATLLLAGAK